MKTHIKQLPIVLAILAGVHHAQAQPQTGGPQPPHPVPWVNPADGITYNHYWLGTSQGGYSPGGYVYYFNDSAPTVDQAGNPTTVGALGGVGTKLKNNVESAWSYPIASTQGAEFGCSEITSTNDVCVVSGIGDVEEHWVWCPNQYFSSDLPVYSSLGNGTLYLPSSAPITVSNATTYGDITISVLGTQYTLAQQQTVQIQVTNSTPLYIWMCILTNAQWNCLWADFPVYTATNYQVVDFGPADAMALLPLTPLSVPSFTQSPSNAVVAAGQGFTFAASATGNPTPTYQWQFSTNGLSWGNISGAVGAAYSLSSSGATNLGYYRVIAVNSQAAITNAAVRLTFVNINMYAGINIEGPIGANYQIESAPTLRGTNWFTLTNITVPSQPYIFIDYRSPTNSMQFYRAVPQ